MKFLTFLLLTTSMTITYAADHPFVTLKELFESGEKPNLKLNTLYSGRCFSDINAKAEGLGFVIKNRRDSEGPLGEKRLTIFFNTSGNGSEFDQLSEKDFFSKYSLKQHELTDNQNSNKVFGWPYSSSWTEIKMNNKYLIFNSSLESPERENLLKFAKSVLKIQSLSDLLNYQTGSYHYDHNGNIFYKKLPVFQIENYTIETNEDISFIKKILKDGKPIQLGNEYITIHQGQRCYSFLPNAK